MYIDYFVYYRKENELVRITECDSEENTIEYSLYPVTRLGDMDLIDEEQIFAKLDEPRDGGWLTFEEDNISEMDQTQITAAVLAFAYDLKDGDDGEFYSLDDLKFFIGGENTNDNISSDKD